MNIISDNLTHYSQAFNVFVKKSNKYTSDRKWAEENFSAAVVHKLGEIRPSDHILRSLGVGSGSGENDIILLRILSQRFARFNHVVVEPARVLLEHFQSAAARESSSGGYWSAPGAANFQWHNETLQEHMAKKSDTSSLNAHEFRDEDYVSTTRVERILSELDIPFTISEQRIVVDITSLFEQDSAEDDLMLDFMTHVAHFRETATDEMKKAVLISYRELAREYEESSGPANGGSADREGDSGKPILIERIWENVIITKD
ncbi:histamine N-methyltransferase B-like [Diadema antillarum]|uniref:histamine N-methyltransferase B-like n=1 Tax=Diadema antillarum TaxID=105358 RepID=UPI003A8892DC